MPEHLQYLPIEDYDEYRATEELNSAERTEAMVAAGTLLQNDLEG
jgi:hypothetical protein